MSDWERELICHVVNKLENIKYLSLQAVANNDLGEILLDYTLGMKNCNIWKYFSVTTRAQLSKVTSSWSE